MKFEISTFISQTSKFLSWTWMEPEEESNCMRVKNDERCLVGTQFLVTLFLPQNISFYLLCPTRMPMIKFVISLDFLLNVISLDLFGSWRTNPAQHHFPSVFFIIFFKIQYSNIVIFILAHKRDLVGAAQEFHNTPQTFIKEKQLFTHLFTFENQEKGSSTTMGSCSSLSKLASQKKENISIKNL